MKFEGLRKSCVICVSNTRPRRGKDVGPSSSGKETEIRLTSMLKSLCGESVTGSNTLKILEVLNKRAVKDY